MFLSPKSTRSSSAEHFLELSKDSFVGVSEGGSLTPRFDGGGEAFQSVLLGSSPGELGIQIPGLGRGVARQTGADKPEP